MTTNNGLLLSIIIPVYKSERFLKRCLDSILFNNDECVEVIIINDGSPGKCREIVMEYVRTYKNIVYLEKENGGLSSARNLGIAHAKGKYCCFVDSDDYVNKDYIFTLKKYLYENKMVDLLIFGLRKVTEDNVILETLCPKKLEIINNEDAINRLFIMNEFRFHAVTKVIKTEHLRDDLIFPLDTYYEDVATTYKWVKCSQNILVIPKILYNYVENVNSITQEKFSNKQFDLWKNAISIKNNTKIGEKQISFYAYFIFRTYVDICRRLSNSSEQNNTIYINQMRSDIKRLSLLPEINRVNEKDMYYWSFLFALFFPNLFVFLYKWIKFFKRTILMK